MIVRRTTPPYDPPPLFPSQWPQIVGTFLSAVGVTLSIVAYIGGLQLAPISAFEADAKEHFKETDLRMAPLLTLAAQIKSDDQNFERIQRELGEKTDRSVYLTEQAAQSKQIDDNKASTLRAAEELSHQVHDLEAKIVSRDENTQHWNDINARIGTIEIRINALLQSIDLTKDRAIMIPK